ncbi:hypothetical protein, unlikely [Trypanosoma brucei brucei TREU927]|uniref:Secreted protein n=1 Tax=Trypanosoma brucei brucei (strain 927/4 GUTat10.1) TaxID=185431 RepID=Q38EH1_TRYB2|nr:hypothetical protein, unlikely [Trypanosoma brucei brucei TREU927]EAN76799.1 hypothetical protein, unlikely [Trypanosoma brucei brucei TREU927]
MGLLCFNSAKFRRSTLRLPLALWIICLVALEDNPSFTCNHTKSQYAAAYRSLTHPFACMASGTAQLSLVPCFAGVSGSVVLKPKLFFLFYKRVGEATKPLRLRRCRDR